MMGTPLGCSRRPGGFLVARVFAPILVVETGGMSACAAISGLDSYSSTEGTREAGKPGKSADGEGGLGDDGTNSSDTASPCSTACSTNIANATAGCVDGACALMCNSDHSLCDGACVNFTSDNNNCGGCGPSYACASNATCQSGVCLGGGSDASADSGPMAREAGQDASCTKVDLPPSVNVDATQWNFAASPTWICTTGATTTITANSSGASIGGDNCGGSATLVDISNSYSQTTGGQSVLVIRLKGLTVTGSHIIQLKGNEPVIFLVNGNVTIDSGGMIDASANGTTVGPGGNNRLCGMSTGTNSTATSMGGGGGGFGTVGGYGADQNGNNGAAGGAVAAGVNLQPLRGGCAGGAGANGTNQGGAGGGAFEISASGTISVGATATAHLSAAGGYSPGASTSVGSNGSGGAGSGGGILLVSPVAATFAHSSVARVHGGGSGSGRGVSATSNAGSNGSTSTNTPAAGGAAPDIGGAAGAAGGLCAGTGTTCAISQAGSNGTHTMVVPPDGSGGGGGGGSVQVLSASASASCK
jgi:hypothetical protein